MASPNGDGAFDDPKHRDAADGVGRKNRRPFRQADAPQQRDDAERHDDKRELPGLDAEIEKEQRERDVVRRQSDLAQRAREAEAVQQSKRSRDQPRRALGQPALAAPAAQDFRRDENDAQRNVASTGADGTCTTPSVASASVMLCATVNAVIVFTSKPTPRTMSTSARTKSR